MAEIKYIHPRRFAPAEGCGNCNHKLFKMVTDKELGLLVICLGCNYATGKLDTTPDPIKEVTEHE